MKPQIRPHRNNGTTGIIDPFSQQVLAKSSLLALEGIAERLQGSFVGAGDNATVAAVVEQDIHGFLQHSLFIAHDNIRRF